MIVTASQDTFLSNDKNKIRLIIALREKLHAAGFSRKAAFEDIVTMMVETAIGSAGIEKAVTIVGEDVDMLVTFTQLNPEKCNVYFQKPGKGKIESKIYNTASFKESQHLKEFKVFNHAFTGCDTT